MLSKRTITQETTKVTSVTWGRPWVISWRLRYDERV